jgi:F-type H+-transporting ATPase subunit delta
VQIYSLIKEQIKFSKITESFILTLIEENNLHLYENVYNEFKKLFDQKNNLTNVTLTVSKKLSIKAKKLVENFIAKNISTKYQLKERFDSKLIGGFILEYNNNIIDLSIKNYLIKIKNELKSKLNY